MRERGEEGERDRGVWRKCECGEGEEGGSDGESEGWAKKRGGERLKRVG